MIDANITFSWIIFWIIWFWYFSYWKKEKNTISLICWILLMIYSYFIENLYLTIWIWLLLMIIPFILNRYK